MHLDREARRSVTLPDPLRSKAAAMLAPTATYRRYTTIGARAGLPREARYSNLQTWATIFATSNP